MPPHAGASSLCRRSSVAGYASHRWCFRRSTFLPIFEVLIVTILVPCDFGVRLPGYRCFEQFHQRILLADVDWFSADLARRVRCDVGIGLASMRIGSGHAFLCPIPFPCELIVCRSIGSRRARGAQTVIRPEGRVVSRNLSVQERRKRGPVPL